MSYRPTEDYGLIGDVPGAALAGKSWLVDRIATSLSIHRHCSERFWTAMKAAGSPSRRIQIAEPGNKLAGSLPDAD